MSRGRVEKRVAVVLLVFMALIPCFVGSLAGQTVPGGEAGAAPAGDQDGGPLVIVGLFVGRISSRQIWSPPYETDGLKGLTAGVFVEARTPVSFLSVRAEAGYAQKGTVVWDESQDPGRNAPARVRSHYLTLPIHGKVSFDVGPAEAYVFGGPTVDFLLSSQCSEEFCQFIRDEKGTVVNAAVGGGVGFRLPGGYTVGLEGRITEGLGDAYLAEFDSARNRSTSVLVRIGRPRRGP